MNLKKELICLQAEFKVNMEGPGYAGLGNKTISHFQSLQLAKVSQSTKWPQDTDQIKTVDIKLY